MIRYSHVLSLPQKPPFDTDHRWTTFLGEFVRPIAYQRHFPYWFSYYGDHAKFRVYTDDQDVLDRIHAKMNDLGLSYRLDKNGDEEEWNETLEGDLGKPRFLAAERTDLQSIDRATKVLNLLHAGAELFLHSLVRKGDYWREEQNEDKLQNPYGSASRSYIHLLHNLAQSDIEVCSFPYPLGSPPSPNFDILSEYYFSHAVGSGQIPPIFLKKHRLKA